MRFKSMSEKEIFDLCKNLLSNEYIIRTGYLKSLIQKTVTDLYDSPIPWYTYPAIDFLVERVPNNISVFEYGCGFGTLWWANRAKRIVVIEHDSAWYKKMVPKFPSNVRHIYRELTYGGDYCRTVKDLSPLKFNIIIIDGRDRVNCCKFCVDSLTPDGVIIFDNTHREQYIPGRDYIKNEGFRELRLYGLTPMVTVENATSIFYRDGNCLNI